MFYIAIYIFIRSDDIEIINYWDSLKHLILKKFHIM